MKIFISVITGLFIVFGVYNVSAENVYNDDAKQIMSEYAELYGNVFETGIEDAEVGKDFSELFPEFTVKEVIGELNCGKVPITPKNLFSALIKLIFNEIYASAKLMAICLALAILSSYLSGIKTGFAENSVSVCGFYVCCAAMAGVCATAFYRAAQCASGAVKNIVCFMRIVVPSVAALLMTSGGGISAAALEPTFIAVAEIAVWVVDSLLIPAVMLAAALNISGSISDRFKTARLVKLIDGTVKWGFTGLMTVFVGLMGIKSIAASGADGLAIKISKFAASNLVPVAGGVLAESVETVMSCTSVIKNSVGIIGMICIGVIALKPILSLGAIMIVFKLTAAAAEPISDSKITECISGLSDSVSVLFSIVSATAVIFIIIITILINAGNGAVTLGR